MTTSNPRLRELSELTAAAPRIPLAHLPTPLETRPRLSAELGGPSLLVKRDDCTGLGVGGNKIRKLEFVIAAALLCTHRLDGYRCLPKKHLSRANRLDKGQPTRQAHFFYDAATGHQGEVEIRPRPGSQSITCQDVAVLARHFGVSYEAAVWRLKSLGHLGSPQNNALIEQKDSGDAFMRLLKLQGPDEKKS